MDGEPDIRTDGQRIMDGEADIQTGEFGGVNDQPVGIADDLHDDLKLAATGALLQLAATAIAQSNRRPLR